MKKSIFIVIQILLLASLLDRANAETKYAWDGVTQSAGLKARISQKLIFNYDLRRDVTFSYTKKLNKEKTRIDSLILILQISDGGNIIQEIKTKIQSSSFPDDSNVQHRFQLTTDELNSKSFRLRVLANDEDAKKNQFQNQPLFDTGLVYVAPTDFRHPSDLIIAGWKDTKYQTMDSKFFAGFMSADVYEEYDQVQIDEREARTKGSGEKRKVQFTCEHLSTTPDPNGGYLIRSLQIVGEGIQTRRYIEEYSEGFDYAFSGSVIIQKNDYIWPTWLQNSLPFSTPVHLSETQTSVVIPVKGTFAHTIQKPVPELPEGATGVRVEVEGNQFYLNAMGGSPNVVHESDLYAGNKRYDCDLKLKFVQ